MARKRNRRGKSRQRRRQTGGLEWVGGRLQAPMYVVEPEPHRPELILWQEWPGGLIVACSLIGPDQAPVSFAESLRQAMAEPLAGPPRRPRRVRVADPSLAAELRRAEPDLEVVTAPTPELNEVLDRMAESLPDRGTLEPSYLAGGKIPEAAVESLFIAAEALYRCAPWNIASDTQVLRLDIPGLGVEGACVSIIGALGESLGLIMFPSLLAFESFLGAAEIGFEGREIDLGAAMLSLNFDRGSELPDAMRREVARHGWPVAGPNAYPTVQHRDPDGMPRPTSEHDLRFATACARAVTAFFGKYPELFESEAPAPVSESIAIDGGLEARITAPYDPGDQTIPSDAELPPLGATPSGPTVGRNEPCPCGSGRKYKKCCLNRDRTERQATRQPAKLHELDQRLVRQMAGFASERFDDAWQRAGDFFEHPDEALSLAVPWSFHHADAGGKTIAERFAEAYRQRLSGPERRWLDAQRAAWLSVWEIQAVDPGRGMTLVDLLTGEEREVSEKSASQTLIERDAILARVVDSDAMSLLCGVHPRSLPPSDAAELIRLMRRRLRRKGPIPPERLRSEKAGRALIGYWEEMVRDRDRMREAPPQLCNTDGEEFVLTTERFEFDPADRAEIERRLAAIEGVDPPQAGDSDQAFRFTRPGGMLPGGAGGTLIGRAEFGNGKLRIETDSIERARHLRGLTEAACGPLVCHRITDHADPMVTLGGQDAIPAGPRESVSAEAAAFVREYKQRFYADWPDQPIPALDDKTPRAVVKTRVGRERVDVLLKEMENMDARLPEHERFDFSNLRAELGIED